MFGTKSCYKTVLYKPVKRKSFIDRLTLGKYTWKKEQVKGVEVIGSGREYAKGALAAGVSEKDAIKAASKVDFYTNDVIEEESLPDETV